MADRKCNACPWCGPCEETVMLGSVGPLCPECRETTEITDRPDGLTRYSQWSSGSACGMDPSENGRWVEYADVRALVAQQAARIAELEARFSGAALMAYVATDLDGHYDVGTTIEQAKQRAGHGCDTVFPLHDISPAFIEFEGKAVKEGK